MNKVLKYGLYAAAATTGLVMAGVAFIAATFDSNAYKAEMVQAVQESRHRTLTLDGDIKLTFFPTLGASLSKVALSEFNSGQAFAAVEEMQAALAFWPLLRGEAVVDALSITGLKATLVRHRDGSTNIDDLLAGSEKTASGGKVKFDIAGVKIARTELVYRDEASAAEYAVRDLTLTTGRLAPGVQTPLDLSARVQASPSRLDLKLQARAALMLDLDNKRYRLDKLDAQFGGAQADNAVELKLAAARLALDGDNLDADTLQLSAKLKGVNTVTATLALPSLSGTTQSFASQALTLGVEASGDALPGKHVSSEMRGRFAFDGSKQNFDLHLAGGLLQSKVDANFAISDFAKPAIRFDVEVDQFDADLYFPPAAPSGKPAPEQTFDLSALKQLNLEGKLHLGALTVAKVKSRDIHLTLKARNGQLNVAPFSARLYEGGVNGSVTVNAAPATPLFTLNQSLSGVDVAALTRDAADFDTLEGHGNLSMQVAAQGNTVTALKQSLSGKLSLSLSDGAIKGINLAKSLREVGSRLGQTRTQDADQDEKTDFSELKASFTLANGVAHGDDLSMKSPLLRLGGNGDIDIGNDRMNYLARATLVKTLQGQGGQDNLSGLTVPVRVQGPFADLKYSLDFGAAVSESAKQKVEAKQQEVKTLLQDKLRGLLH